MLAETQQLYFWPSVHNHLTAMCYQAIISQIIYTVRTLQPSTVQMIKLSDQFLLIFY